MSSLTAGQASSVPLDYAPRKTGFKFPRWMFWLTGVGVGVFFLGSILLPSLCKSSETANRVKCAANLRQIGTALQLFAKEHNGKYPDQMAELIETEDLTPAVFTCPSGSADVSSGATPEQRAADLSSPKYCSYIYLKENLGNPDRAIVYERPDDHDKDGMNVLYGDFHVEFQQSTRPAGQAALIASGIPADVFKTK